ncbi:MAG: hypothetical protein H6955_02595 [Chromatiaceae bacterium]|nr:hypothetical protein [Chromatiaceae bacterium]
MSIRPVILIVPLISLGPAQAAPLATYSCPAGTAGPHAAGVVLPTGMKSATGNPARDLHRVVLSDPAAICNDGSPGVYYVRPGTTDPDKWHIHLMGGFSCTDEASCAERWCGDASGGASLSELMSSDWTPDAAFFNGFADGSPRWGAANPLDGWTQVVVYYCGSDMHRGRAGATTLGGMDLDFAGGHILEATLRDLQTGTVAVDTDGDGLDESVPDLDYATHVLLSGSSAGGVGAAQQADRIRGALRATNPEVPFRVVVDAAIIPKLQNWLTPAEAETVWTGFYNDQSVWLADTDDSCLAANASDPWRCEDAGFVVKTALATPVFVRSDLLDFLLFDGVDAVVQDAGYAAITEADYASYMADRLDEIATTVVSSNGVAAGAYGPMCRRHVGITREDAALFQLMEDPGVQLTFVDAVYDWMIGTGLNYSQLVDDYAVAEADTLSPSFLWLDSCPY